MWQVYALLVSSTIGCFQVQVNTIRNTGKVTSFWSSSDKIQMTFGVDDLFSYTFAKSFGKSETVSLPAGAISFPCFDGSTLKLQLTAYGAILDDVTNVVLDCNKLSGFNMISVDLFNSYTVSSNSAVVTFTDVT
jgi:hypothetical protein